jgi:hypothetical protein
LRHPVLSSEYSLLKELGVREALDLHELIFHIRQEHYRGSKTETDYQFSSALMHFVENFRQYDWNHEKMRRLNQIFF